MNTNLNLKFEVRKSELHLTTLRLICAIAFVHHIIVIYR